MSDFDPPIPPRPSDPGEAAIWDDVFNKDETDLGYFLRRQRQVRDQQPVTNVVPFKDSAPDADS